MTIKRGFPPVVDTNITLLILGSLPGELSLASGQYYANPQNRFWMLVGEVIEVNLVALSYQERLDILLKNHIGLWDVVAEATRVGSLDINIRGHVQNDLISLLNTLPKLRTIAFNGRTAEKLGMTSLKQKADDYDLIRLPSSSPAHTRSYGEKLCQWLALGNR
jgi:hypoxanthine-DNA glycosylase